MCVCVYLDCAASDGLNAEGKFHVCKNFFVTVFHEEKWSAFIITWLNDYPTVCKVVQC